MTTTLTGPDATLIQTLRQHRQETETSGSLPQALLDIIVAQRWFQLLVPASSGGLELPLPEVVQLFETLAFAEANTAWCVNLGAGANMFAGYLDAGLSRQLFQDPRTCCAGSGAVSGTATRIPGGYMLSGRWKYASGANHATHFTANAWLLDEKNNALTENGAPVFRSFIIPSERIINHRNWDAIGLKATSSNDFEAREVFVPETHVFSLLSPSAFALGPLYRFPFAQMAIVNMTSMITGIALRFLELYHELAVVKKPLHSDQLLCDHPQARAIAGAAETRFREARDTMHTLLKKTWAYYAGGGSAGEPQLQALSMACRKAASAARNVLNELYPLFGMSVLDPQSEACKVWRDGMTASQHYLMSPLSGPC